MTTLHETLQALTDEQVALLYDLKADEVAGWRELAREEAEEGRRGDRVVGLLLREPAGTQHSWTADEDVLVLSPEFNAAEVAATLGVSRGAVEARRRRLRGVDEHQTDRDRQALSISSARHTKEPWTETEDQRVAEYAGPLIDLALELGRTYQAVCQRRHALRCAQEATVYDDAREEREDGA